MVKKIDDLTENNELTARQIRARLKAEYPSLEVSLSTIKKARKEAGWTNTRPYYCQLIREVSCFIKLNEGIAS